MAPKAPKKTFAQALTEGVERGGGFIGLILRLTGRQGQHDGIPDGCISAAQAISVHPQGPRRLMGQGGVGGGGGGLGLSPPLPTPSALPRASAIPRGRSALTAIPNPDLTWAAAGSHARRHLQGYVHAAPGDAQLLKETLGVPPPRSSPEVSK